MRASMFERTTVERYAGYLRRVLAGMVAAESEVVERLALMEASGAATGAGGVERDAGGVSAARSACTSCSRSRWKESGSGGGDL